MVTSIYSERNLSGLLLNYGVAKSFRGQDDIIYMQHHLSESIIAFESENFNPIRNDYSEVCTYTCTHDSGDMEVEFHLYDKKLMPILIPYTIIGNIQFDL